MERAVRRHDAAGPKGEAHASPDLPAGNVRGESIRVEKLDVFLRLVAGRRIELALPDAHPRIRRLRGRDALAVEGGGGVGEEKRAAAGQMNVKNPLRFRPHLVLVAPFGPARVFAS